MPFQNRLSFYNVLKYLFFQRMATGENGQVLTHVPPPVEEGDIKEHANVTILLQNMEVWNVW